mgnify:CR=1 FL=1
MLADDLSNRVLEKQRRFLVLGVQLPVHEDSAVEILLRRVAEHFVFAHDALVHVGDEVEVGVAGVPVAVDFVRHGRGSGGGGEEFLDHDEVAAWVVLVVVTCCYSDCTECGGWEGRVWGVWETYETDMDEFGK